MITRRFAPVFLVVLLVLATSIAAAAPATRDTRRDGIEAVSWSVDKTAHTITVEVHIAFFTADTSETSVATVLDRIDFIKAAIMHFWNDAPFKCYQLKVKLFTRLVQKQSQVGANEVPVKLDDAIYSIGDTMTIQRDNVVLRRSFVVPRNMPGNYLSESPADVLVPETGTAGMASEWALLDIGLTYGHEFGHLIGLDDNYTEHIWKPKPGAKDDLMGSGTTVDPTTMTRLIRRAGINDKDLPCPLTWDLTDGQLVTPFDKVTLAIHAWTCDYDPPSNAPGVSAVMKFEGVVTTTGAHSDPITGSASGGGTEPISATYPLGDPNLRVTFSTGLILSQPVEYQREGLHSTRTASLVTTDGAVDILDRSDFTNGAKECK